MRKEGKLFVISGPSGVGKDTVIARILQKNDNVALSVSCTTRAPRGQEKDGVDYYFKSVSEFEQLIEEDGFLEYAKVFDNYYGTPAAAVREKLQQGRDVILEIDVQGAINVRNKAPGAVLVFIAPPSMEVLRKRLEGRKTETPEAIEKRFSRAASEMKLADKYNYQVVNDDLDQAVEELNEIIVEEHNKQ